MTDTPQTASPRAQLNDESVGTSYMANLPRRLVTVYLPLAIFMFVLLTIGTLAILDRSAAWLWRLRPVWGLIWLLVLVLPWFVAIFWRAGDTFFADSVGGDGAAAFFRAHGLLDPSPGLRVHQRAASQHARNGGL